MRKLIANTTTLLDCQPVFTQKSYEFKTDNEGIEREIINLYPEMQFQKLEGFGGALTEAAGYVFSKMPADVQDKILEDYYGKDGLNYSVARVHIDSCDFSLGNYSAMNDKNDVELKSFSLERDEKYIIPLIKAANQKSKKPLSLMLTPWSPPPFMKSNGEKNHGGHLLPEFFSMWADYLCRYIKEYRSLGFNVDAISIQNEPKAAQTWDSCVYTAAEEREFIRNYFAPALVKNNMDVKIYIWDHNKERAFDRALEIICDEEMDKLVSGIAVHWYSGDHFEALDLIKRKFPNKQVVFSEACVEYLVVKNQSQLVNANMYAHDIIGDLNGGMDTFLDWNIVLDETGGPNHVNNFCDAPIICDTEKGTYRKNLSFYYIGHFSKYIMPGAIRIGISRFTDKLETVAFKNPDKTITVVVLNRTETSIEYCLRLENTVCRLEAKAGSITTCIIE